MLATNFLLSMSFLLLLLLLPLDPWLMGAPLRPGLLAAAAAGAEGSEAAAATAAPEGAAEGFLDCTSESADSESEQRAIRRAYRRLQLDLHPDVQGRRGLDAEESEAVAADLTRLRDAWVQEPLRFHVHRALRAGPGRLRPLRHRDDVGLRSGSGSQEGAGVAPLWAAIDEEEDRSSGNASDSLNDPAAAQIAEVWWPYLKVRMDLSVHAARLRHGGSWSLAFSLLNDSTVHYGGDERVRGYDVCCDLMEGSRCVRRTAVEDVEQEAPEAYDRSDCPLELDAQGRLVATVHKPLHKRMSGRWGAALRVRDLAGDVVLCWAVALEYRRSENPEPAPTSIPGGEEPPYDPASAAFHFVAAGEFCSDGGDLLEGQVDHYGASRFDSPHGASELYGGNCREKCRKRKKCRFYTAYSSGWCQLSTRCENRGKTGDPLVATFVKEVPAARRAGGGGRHGEL